MSLARAFFGPVLVGTFLDVLLLGTVISQVFLYYSTQKRDNIRIKLYIATLLFATIINSVLNIIPVYVALVADFDNPAALNRASWAVIAAPALQAIISYLVQVFLAWRIHILLSKFWLMGVVILLATGQLVSGIGATIWFEQVGEYSQMFRIKPMATGAMVCGAGTDLAIAGVLVFYVTRNKINEDTTLQSIFRLFLPTGLVACLLAITQLVIFFVAPPAICSLVGLIMPNTYILTLLSSLNIRRGWKFSHEPDCTVGSTAGSKPQTRSTFTSQPDVIPLGDLTFDDDVEARQDVKRVSLASASNELTYTYNVQTYK
jgi:hypothetical protein